MENMAYYTERLQCSDEEKRACLETVRALTQAAYIARREGLLAIEILLEEQENPSMEQSEPRVEPDALFRCMKDPFFRDCILDLTYALEPEMLARAQETLLAAGNYRGRDFLNNVLVMHGIRTIQEGCRNVELGQALFRWFGADWRETVLETVNKEWERLETPHAPPPTSYVPEFDRLVELSPERRELLLTSLDIRDQGFAFWGAGEAVRDWMLGCEKAAVRDAFYRDVGFFVSRGAVENVQRRIAALVFDGE